MKNIFANLESPPADPIFGLVEGYNNDTRDNKVNLAIGVLVDEEGNVTAPKSVQSAMADVVSQCTSKPAYLPITGHAPYCTMAAELIFGDSYNAEKTISVQAPGGTGALRTIGEFIKTYINNDPTVFVSNPTWSNHRDIFAQAGFTIADYQYFCSEKNAFDVDLCAKSLQSLEDESIILLHASSHNPSGSDPTTEEWDNIFDIIVQKNLIPIVDCAYQGLGRGITEDVYIIQKLSKASQPFFLAQSFSKSLGLYSQRTGAVHITLADKSNKQAVLGNLKKVIRRMFSNPPAYGAYVAEKVLGNNEYRVDWEQELADARARLQGLRAQLVEGLQAHDVALDVSSIAKQNGLFAYTGLSKEQAEALRNDHAIYLLNSGRICVAALNQGNINYVIDSIAKVV